MRTIKLNKSRQQTPLSTTYAIAVTHLTCKEGTWARFQLQRDGFVCLGLTGPHKISCSLLQIRNMIRDLITERQVSLTIEMNSEYCISWLNIHFMLYLAEIFIIRVFWHRLYIWFFNAPCTLKTSFFFIWKSISRISGI